ncbi:hypothetical protein WN944_027337 [Citrus x changshan-huyou]|uniref:Uncharacterized protein n=1 Tax=Citrus x changshan-huyou TaxID=2935761 RepID=A0AAP0LHT1_9ROSI
MMNPHYVPTTLDPLKHTTIVFYNPSNKPIDTQEMDGVNLHHSDLRAKGHTLPYSGDPLDLYGGNMDLEMEDDESDLTYVEDEEDDATTDGEDSFVEDTPMNEEDGTHESANKEISTPLYILMIMSISVMFWNVQRAGASNFRLSFDVIIQCYTSSMVVMFEPRISGQKANNFIRGCGFERSHRIEAVGFSGGIWILWRDFLTVEIILNHKQFVHFKIISSNGLES